MISGKQRRGRAGQLGKFQWCSTKLRPLCYGDDDDDDDDDDDSPLDLESHEFIPHFHSSDGSVDSGIQWPPSLRVNPPENFGIMIQED